MKMHAALTAVSAVALVAAGTSAVFAQTLSGPQAPETVSPRVLSADEFEAFMSNTGAAPSQGRGWPLMEYRYGMVSGVTFYTDGVACRTADGALGQGVTEADAAAAAAAGLTRCNGTVTNNQGVTNPALVGPAAGPNNTTNGNGTNGANEVTRANNPGIWVGQGPVDGSPPDGITALPHDMFVSRDYYVDRALWSDPYYFRCNGPLATESLWGAYGGNTRIGDFAIGSPSARWGDCNVDYPAEYIFSPYPFETAQEHYETLMAEAESRGGPTQYSWENPPPDWTGVYARAFGARHDSLAIPNWYHGNLIQIPTQLELFTEEYKYRMMQEHYHQGVTNIATWSSQYCWAEGFMRRFSQFGVRQHLVVTSIETVMVFAGLLDNMITMTQIGREFNMNAVASGGVPFIANDNVNEIPRDWYGNTIGFWDGDVLVTWTSNILHWKAHGFGEHSDYMQSIEIYTPYYDAGGEYQGFRREAVLYDPVSLSAPQRIVQDFNRMPGGITAVNYGSNQQYQPDVRCLQTIWPIDNKPNQVPPGTEITMITPDFTGRPWADFLVPYETHMQTQLRPDAAAASAALDIF